MRTYQSNICELLSLCKQAFVFFFILALFSVVLVARFGPITLKNNISMLTKNLNIFV